MPTPTPAPPLPIPRASGHRRRARRALLPPGGSERRLQKVDGAAPERRGRVNGIVLFTHPWSRDWVVWWALAVGVLSVLAFTIHNVNRAGEIHFGGLLIDSAIGLPANFVVFVLPVV